VETDDQTLSGGNTLPDRSSRRPLAPGDRIGRYVVSERIGAGGMGVVYRARDPELDRDVALKLLDVLIDDHGSRVADHRARMTREAQAMARLSHPNVITVHDVGEHDDGIFIAMDFVEGMTLSRWLSLHAPSVDAIVDAFILAGRGLIAAHEAALVHRDFKPDNVMVELRPGTSEVVRLVVMDFGLARGTGEASEDVELSGGSNTLDANLTATGGTMGTPAYMSPEQHTQGEVGPASDQFSFCVSLYEALYRQRPFAGDGAMAIAFAAIEGRVRPTPKRDGVPGWLERATLRGLAPLPESRWPTMSALVDELSCDRGRAKRFALLGLVAVAAGSFAWSQGREPDPCDGVAQVIEEVWNPAVGEQIELAFRSSDVPGAKQQYKALRVQLDTYAASWTAARRDACRSAGQAKAEVAERRRRCLDGSLDHLGATVAVLADPDDEAIRRAASVGPTLRRIEICSNDEFLAAELEPPPENVADRVAELRAEASRIEANIQLGGLEEAARAAEAAVLEARALGYAPLVAELTYFFGDAQSELGKHEDALALWEEAYLSAVGAGHYMVAARSAGALGFAYAVDEQDLEAAKRWLEHGRTMVERAGNPPEIGRVLRTIEGSIAWAEGRYDDAVEATEEALAIAEVTYGRRAPQTARMVVNLGLYETNAGRPSDALPRFERALEIYEAMFGPEHPDIADTLLNRGIAQGRAGLPKESLESYQRALAIREKITPEHVGIATLVQNIAINYAENGDNDKALPMFERALELRTRALDERHPLVGSAHLNLAASLKLADRFDEASDHLQTALDVIAATQGPESPAAGIAHFELGGTRLQQGEHEKAVSHLQTARDVLAKSLGAEHPNMVMAHAGLAQAQAKLGRIDEAVKGYETALAIAAKTDTRPMDIAMVKADFVAVRFEHGRIARDEAEALAREALAQLPEGTEEHDEVVAWLRDLESESQ